MDGMSNGMHSAASVVANSLVPASTLAHADALTTKTASSTAGAAASTAGTITSNDFLTLLVTEMKNQDPTQPTDPNAYIQQLVGVNSLQQLIAINKGLSTLESGTTTSATMPTNSPI